MWIKRIGYGDTDETRVKPEKDQAEGVYLFSEEQIREINRLIDEAGLSFRAATDLVRQNDYVSVKDLEDGI